MSIKNFTEYNLSQDAYAAFDATTLKSLIIDRLNESSVFRDQNYEGSNINAFIDVVAYMYHVLLFYLNTTSSESTFTTAELYQNMNKLVSNLGYKPTGNQTSFVAISLNSSLTVPGMYAVPRFSFALKDGITYTTLKDIAFEKTTTGSEDIVANYDILHQGALQEYSQYTASGEDYETLTVVDINPNPGMQNTADQFIADNTFTVFVKNVNTGTWTEWSETSSLYLEASNSLTYEKRLNENGNYVFKFGNGVAGAKLNSGDLVQVYYILSDNALGLISSGFLDNTNFIVYNTPTFLEILNDVYGPDTNFITAATTQYIDIFNSNNSTPIAAAETVTEIRNNAPKMFALQNRLVTSNDYQVFVGKVFNNIVKSVSVVSNDEYVTSYIKYFYDIGLNKPNDNCRVLFNQVNYSNSTCFNNVYAFCVPTNTILNETIPNYVNSAQKQLITNECNTIKDLTHNVVISDPVYKSFSLGAPILNECVTVEYVRNNTRLLIYKDSSNIMNSTALKNKVLDLFMTAFNSIQLGSVVDLNSIATQILNIPGVTGLSTKRVDANFETPGISCIVWNPLYEDDDREYIAQNYQLQYFQYAYFYEISKLINNMVLVNS